jgi:hypothetical protein
VQVWFLLHQISSTYSTYTFTSTQLGYHAQANSAAWAPGALSRLTTTQSTNTAAFQKSVADFYDYWDEIAETVSDNEDGEEEEVDLGDVLSNKSSHGGSWVSEHSEFYKDSGSEGQSGYVSGEDGRSAGSCGSQNAQAEEDDEQGDWQQSLLEKDIAKLKQKYGTRRVGSGTAQRYFDG